MRNGHFVVMNEVPSVHVKRLLVCLVSDTVLNLGAKHHLTATHEVVHHIVKFGLEGLQIHAIEEDFVIGGDLYSNVSFDEVDESSDVDAVILRPLLVVLGIGIVLIFNYFEKQYLTRTPDNESLVIEKIHLAQILVCHLLKSIVIRVISLDGEGLSLSVEAVDHIFVGIVKTLIGEVHHIAIHVYFLEGPVDQ